MKDGNFVDEELDCMLEQVSNLVYAASNEWRKEDKSGCINCLEEAVDVVAEMINRIDSYLEGNETF